MDNLSEQIGRFLGLLLFAIPALFFLRKAFQPAPVSRRLADIALFCGLSALVLPELVLNLSASSQSTLLLASGIARLILALLGIVLAGVAFARRRDGGVGVGRPVVAAGFCLLHLVVGLGLATQGWMAQPGTPWVYQAPDGAFRLTVPSGHWKQTTDADGNLTFVRVLPDMQARVKVKRQQSQKDFVQAAAGFRAFVESEPQRRGRAMFQDGTTAAGNPYSYCTVMDSADDGRPVFVAHSVV